MANDPMFLTPEDSPSANRSMSKIPKIPSKSAIHPTAVDILPKKITELEKKTKALLAV